jgi:heme-degrading monooxygenase HmoA
MAELNKIKIMRLTPALEFEKLRKDPESWNKIFLHKDGKFFRAYEWSAWLIKTVVCTEEMQKERGDQKMLTANRYVTKKGEYVSVGFPLESLAKFMIGFEDFDPNTVDDYSEFTITTFDEESSNYEELLAAFEEWKHALPEKDAKQAQKASRTTSNVDTDGGRVGMFQILSQVLSYPIESKTPAENAEFIATLKRQLSSLL